MKAAAAVLIAVVMCIVLSKYSKDHAVIVVICVCCMVAVSAMGYLETILSFVERIQSIGNLNGELLQILFKTVGIGLLTEITSLICADSGNAALGKSIQLLASVIILWLCLPMFDELLELVEGVLGAV